MIPYQYPTINSFREITLGEKRPFVLCDIDETVLRNKYPFQYFYDMIQEDYSDDPDLSPDFIISLAAEYYTRSQRCFLPTHTDLAGFNDLIQRVNEKGGEIQFLTARGESSDVYTRNQLKHIGIDESKFRIHYCAGVAPSKGHYIEQFIKLNEEDEVIFIDDYDHYLFSVTEKHPQIQCYKFVAIYDSPVDDGLTTIL